MNRILTFQMQLIIGLLVGMGLSFISVRAYPQPAAAAIPSPSPIASSTATQTAIGASFTTIPSPMLTGTPKPYVTLPGVWLVRAQFSSTVAPQVLKVTFLEQGRITPFDQGDYQAELLDTSGNVLFRGEFVVNFLQGDPLRAVDEVTTLLVLPAVQQAVQIRLKTPQGATTYDLPR